VAERIDDGDTSAGGQVLRDHVLDEDGFPGTGLPDQMNVSAAGVVAQCKLLAIRLGGDARDWPCHWLDHPGSTGSIMGYRYDERVRQLQIADIAAAQLLYGPPKDK
jgi:hypothetical protein